MATIIDNFIPDMWVPRGGWGERLAGTSSDCCKASR